MLRTPSEETLFAEWVAPGHPDRLADAIAESVVDHALRIDPMALAGVEVAVHTNKVFIDGRIAAGEAGAGDPATFLPRLIRDVYARAGYDERWYPAPSELVISHDLCSEPLTDDERLIRNISDDQNIVIGYAVDSPATGDLPPAHWLAHHLGRSVSEWRRDVDGGRTFGPDFKLLVHLARTASGFTWKRLTLSLQHVTGTGYQQQYGTLLPIVKQLLEPLEEDLPGMASTFRPETLYLNGAGDFCQGGPDGDNGLSGKKLVVDHYGPGVPIGGGAITGKDPHKVDKCGPLAARDLARRLVRDGANEALTRLAWSPGEASPFLVEARVADRHGFWQNLPADQLPAREDLEIRNIHEALELGAVTWSDQVTRPLGSLHACRPVRQARASARTS